MKLDYILFLATLLEPFYFWDMFVRNVTVSLKKFKSI